MALRTWLLVSGLMATGLMAGCNRSDALIEPLVPAGGKLLIDGKPMDGVLISFVPEASKKGRRGGTALTNDKGEFTVTDLIQNKPGLPVGKYTLTYSRMRKPDGSAAPATEPGKPIDPGNIQVESFPVHLRNPDPTKAENQVEIPKDGNKNLELKASLKNTGKIIP